MCGDSTNPLDVEKLLNNKKPNLMVTDPPYGVEYDPEWRKESHEFKGNAKNNVQTGIVQNDNKADWADVYSLFTGNVAYIWHSSQATHVVARNLEDCDFKLISQIIWAKQHFAISRGDYHWQHYPCWYAVRNNSTHNWQGARDQTTIWEIKNNNPLGTMRWKKS
jgi:DNA modification methylase